MNPNTMLRRATLAALTAGFATIALAGSAGAQSPVFSAEKSLAAGKAIHLHNISGDVRVLPSTDGKVSIKAYRGHGGDDDDAYVEVNETSYGLIACVMYKDADGHCDEDGYSIHSHNDGWGHNDHGSLDLEVRIPANVEVQASSVSGDVSVGAGEGRIRATSVSGDIKVSDVRISSLEARSVSGDVDATVSAFSGSGDIEVKSVSGDVTLQMPKDLDADLSLSTVSGDLTSDYPLTLNGRVNRRKIEARIGKGGRDLDISTVSGDVRLKARS